MVEASMTPDEIVTKLAQHFGGRDPIKELSDRVKAMDKSSLEKIVLMSANTVGTAIKRGDYENEYEAILHLSMGADMILNAYDMALMTIDPAFNGGGTA